jgi:hypothetical protein
MKSIDVRIEWNEEGGEHNYSISDIENLLNTFDAIFSVQELPVSKTKTCQWELDDETGYWITGCKHPFNLETGTPEENYIEYCPYCGNKVVKV